MSQRNFILVQILAAHGLSDENTPAAVKTTCMWRYSYAGRSPATFDFSLFLIIRNYYLINAHKRMTNKLFIRLEAPQKKILIITIIRIYTPRSIYIFIFLLFTITALVWNVHELRAVMKQTVVTFVLHISTTNALKCVFNFVYILAAVAAKWNIINPKKYLYRYNL